MSDIRKAIRQEIPTCDCEIEKDPGLWLMCGQPSIATWTFPNGNTIYCCQYCDQSLMDAQEEYLIQGEYR